MSLSSGEIASHRNHGIGNGCDAVEMYFECITTCSIDDGECITRCVQQLRDAED